jgi:hypothetical protein
VLRKIGVLPAVVCARLKSALEKAASAAKHKLRVNVEKEGDLPDTSCLKASVLRLETTNNADTSSKRSALLAEQGHRNRIIEVVFDI